MAPKMTMSLANAATNNTVDDAALNKTVLNYAILNGALELLPQSWASVPIIPLQIKWSIESAKLTATNSIKAISVSFLPLLGLE